MSEPRTIELISAHELASAAYTYGYRWASPTFTPGERMAAQQRVRSLLLAEAPPEAKTRTPAEVAALLRRAAARRREIGIAADALAEAEYHAARDLDGDARVAAEADVQRAARALAAALRDDALTQTEEPTRG